MLSVYGRGENRCTTPWPSWVFAFMEKAALPPADKTARATGMLILVTLLWGLSFPLMKHWQEAAKECPGGAVIGSLTLIGVRMTLAVAVLAPIRPRLFWGPRLREHQVGAILGITFFLGFFLQVLGLRWTTPALSAFITSLGSAWVPLLGWVWYRLPLRATTLAGLAVGVSGTAVLGINPEAAWSLGRGEVLTLLSSLVFAVEILLLDRLGKTVDSANITATFMATCGACALLLATYLATTGPGLGNWMRWSVAMTQEPTNLRDMAILVVLSTVLAFHWMNVYQPRVPVATVALVYLLEPVFASICSVLLGLDPFSSRLVLGGGLILAGNLIVEWPFRVRASAVTSHPLNGVENR
jgi:drug/metabolite transporter (DMT)-like permease